jgi:hypothetical protein
MARKNAMLIKQSKCIKYPPTKLILDNASEKINPGVLIAPQITPERVKNTVAINAKDNIKSAFAFINSPLFRPSITCCLAVPNENSLVVIAITRIARIIFTKEVANK